MNEADICNYWMDKYFQERRKCKVLMKAILTVYNEIHLDYRKLIDEVIDES